MLVKASVTSNLTRLVGQRSEDVVALGEMRTADLVNIRTTAAADYYKQIVLYIVAEIETNNYMVVLENTAETKKNKTAVCRSSTDLDESCAYYAAGKAAVAALKASKKAIYNSLF